jgi:hypothetical protein
MMSDASSFGPYWPSYVDPSSRYTLGCTFNGVGSVSCFDPEPPLGIHFDKGEPTLPNWPSLSTMDTMGLFNKKPKPGPPPIEPPTPVTANASADPGPPEVGDTYPELLWLADAPLFIDEVQVNAFYDAVLRPDYELTSVALGNSISAQTTLGGTATIGKAQLEASLEYGRTTDRRTDTTLTPISNSYRHLLAMALHYAGRASDRLVISNAGTISTDPHGPVWLEEAFILETPRPLVFLDVPARTELMPAALETTGELVNVLADRVADQLRDRNGSLEPPDYPGSLATPAEKQQYFTWFMENYDDQLALKVVEESAGTGNIEWIDFNLPLGGGQEFLHLHLAARANYSTDVFAYNFVRRGFNHGLRIVGTLKTGPDHNVLAVFEH